MQLAALFGSLSDATRLRILNLLQHGPLCVCHLQDVLDEPQVKVSKHLRHLRTQGLVDVRREGAWRIYRLAAPLPTCHRAVLDTLTACAATEPTLRRDGARLARARPRIELAGPGCAAPPRRPRRTAPTTSRRLSRS